MSAVEARALEAGRMSSRNGTDDFPEDRMVHCSLYQRQHVGTTRLRPSASDSGLSDMKRAD